MDNKKLRESLNEFISIVDSLEEECEKAKTASACHLEYFKALRVGNDLQSIVVDKILPFIEKHKSDKIAITRCE